MSEKLAVLFPGNGYHADKPLLYYAAMKYAAAGYETVRLRHAYYTPEDETLVRFAEEEFVRQIEESKLDFSKYEEVVFIGKSLGTAVCPLIADRYRVPAHHILLTPWDGTRPFLKRNARVALVVSGTKDPYFDPDELRAICQSEGIPLLPVEGVGHNLEVKGDVSRSLAIVKAVVDAMPVF